MTTKIRRIYWTVSLWMILAQSFFFATYQIFLVDKGLSLIQINLTNFAFMISNFILEIPTGAYADIFGRRRSVALGCFIMALSFLIYFFSGNFWLFVIAEIIGALGMTFISGALEAWMVDALKFHNYEGSLEGVYRTEGRYKLIGVVLGSSIGAWIGNYNLALPWLLTAIGTALLGVFVLVKLREDYFIPTKTKLSFSPIKKIARESVRYGWGHKGIMYAIIFGSILFMNFQAFNMQWPIVFKAHGLSVAELGWLFGGISIAIYFGNEIAVKIAQKFKSETNGLIFSQIVIALGMILAAGLTSFGNVLTWFLVHEFGRGIFKPLRQAYLNRRIPSDKRATVLSFDAMITQFGAAIGLVMSGILAEEFSIKIAWLVSGLIIAVCVPIFYHYKNSD